jgi:hypothetical protein
MAVARLPPLFLSFLLIIGQAAWAQPGVSAEPVCPTNPNWSTNRQMTLTVRERPGQRPVLLAEGAIDADLVQRLQEALKDFAGDEIWLRSPGGDARAGNQAALVIRGSGATTRIPAGWACNGACAFMFMGGIRRTVEPSGLFILQATTFTGAGNRAEVGQTAAQLATADSDLLMRMGVARALLTELLYRLPDGGRRCLSRAELARYNVVNGGSAPER